MTKYYIGEYGFDMKLAALLAACFSLPGGVLRAVGGWISDRYGAYKTTWWVMWVCWVAFFILSYPQTHFTVLTAGGPRSFDIALGPVSFTVLLFIVSASQWRSARPQSSSSSSDEFGENIGAVSGIVGLAGDSGGVRAAHHVRRAAGPDRHPLQRLHAAVRHRLRLPHFHALQFPAGKRGHCPAASR